MPETTIHLVRHGQSQANVEGRLSCTPPGPGLTELGHLQALAARDLLLGAARIPQLVVVSPMRRTIETAAPLIHALGVAPVWAPELGETRFGAWDGWQADELATFSRRFRRWARDPEVLPPGGESLSAVARRVTAYLTRLASTHPGQCIAAFSHMHALKGFVMTVEGVPWTRHGEFQLPNCAVVTAHWDGSRWQGARVDVTKSRPACARHEVS